MQNISYDRNHFYDYGLCFYLLKYGKLPNVSGLQTPLALEMTLPSTAQTEQDEFSALPRLLCYLFFPRCGSAVIVIGSVAVIER